MTRVLARLSFAALLVALPYAARATHSDLAAEWTFSEESGDVAADTSGHENHGTLKPPMRVERVVAERGRAILFPSMPAGPAWVQMPAGTTTELYEFDGGLTLEAFIKPDVLPPVGRVASGRIRYILWGDDDVFGLALRANDPEQALLYGAVSCRTSSGVPDVSATAHFPHDRAGIFTHVALTFAEGTLRLFIDGVQVAEAVDAGDPPCGSRVGPIGFRNLVQIGGDETTQLDPETLRTFRGVIDDVRIWRRALSPAEIADAAGSASCTSDVECDDGNSCTTDTCNLEAGCSQTLLPGIEGARCEVEKVRAPDACGGQLVRKLERLRQKNVGKVLRFLRRIERGPKPAKLQKLLDRADRALAKVDGKLEAAKLAERIDPACGTELRELIAEVRAIIASLRS
jgi:hypothetical protein